MYKSKVNHFFGMTDENMLGIPTPVFSEYLPRYSRNTYLGILLGLGRGTRNSGHQVLGILARRYGEYLPRYSRNTP